jgi:acetyl-CoA carboxylase biotin carboxyl carrier protein
MAVYAGIVLTLDNDQVWRESLASQQLIQVGPSIPLVKHNPGPRAPTDDVSKHKFNPIRYAKRWSSKTMAEEKVESEVTGTVWKVLVEVGSQVAEEEPLMILESMKMEIPVEAPCAGKVSELLVNPEDSVEEGQIVAVLSTD